MSSRSAHRGRRTRALKGPRLGGTLTCELPVSSAFCLQIGKIRMHQKPGIVAPYTGISHSCFQCFKYFFLCHMKYTQVCKAGGKRQQQPKVRQTEAGVLFHSNKEDGENTHRPSVILLSPAARQVRLGFATKSVCGELRKIFWFFKAY